MAEQITFFCEQCNKERNIPKNLLNKLEKNQISLTEAKEKARAAHIHKKHSVILGVKFKLYINSEYTEKINAYMDEYAKAVNFAAAVINKLRSPFIFQGKFDKETNKFVFTSGECDYCQKQNDISYVHSRSGKKICRSCYDKEFSVNAIRKKVYPTRGRKSNPNYNIFNATHKLSGTHYSYAVDEAFQLLEANKRQRQQRIKRMIKDKRKLREFEDIAKYSDKRYELPMKERQREKRYVHISQKDRANELKGYTMAKVYGKIKILRRNTEREEKSLRKKSPIISKGKRIMLYPQGVQFEREKNKVKVSISKDLPKEFEFSGTNVASAHGRLFFEEKLKEILKQKPKYSYLIRKQINKDKDSPKYEYYLQYTTEIPPKAEISYKGVIGIDRGSNPNLAVLAFLEKEKDKPSIVRFIRGSDIVALKVQRRKHLYFLKGAHNKKAKIKNIRLIEPRIQQILHTKAKEIVELAKDKNAAIALEQLEKIKKSKFRQRKIEKFRFSLFNFKTLSTFITYKAKKEGIRVIEVPPEMTSQTCSHCHSVDTQRPYKKPNAKFASYSLFKCNKCGVELNADYNAAFNIAQKGLKILNS